MQGISIGGIIYLVLGVLVATSQGYFASLTTLGQLLSGLIAIFLWPLLLLGANLHLAL